MCKNTIQNSKKLYTIDRKEYTMLEYLHIKDFLLIEEATLEFDKKLNVLTGESGAGKSCIIKAILFLLGEKISNTFKEQAFGKPSVEGIFYTKDSEFILRREFLPESGRSRFFLNGTLTSQEVVHTLKNRLLLYTSQHAQQKLLQPAFHTHILDTVANIEPLCKQRDTLLQALRLCRKQQEELYHKYIALDEKRELLLYQQHLIEEVQPKENEEIQLEAKKEAWKKDEKARTAIQSILTMLDTSGEYNLVATLQELRKYSTNLVQYNNAVEHYSVLIDQFIHCIRNIEATITDIERTLPSYDIEKIESRLFTLAQLKRTLRKSSTFDLALFAQEIEETLAFLDVCSLDLQKLHNEEMALLQELCTIVTEINQKRQQHAIRVSEVLTSSLKPLGFSDALHITFEFTDHVLWNTADTTSPRESHAPAEQHIQCIEQRARILWAPHAGQTPLPLDAIASGGELARITLAIYCLLAEQTEQTIIFDEVDTGIGGATLKSVTERMQELAQKQQVLLITHWPQMARCADKHFFVEKVSQHNTTKTRVVALNDDARVQELKRMNMEE